MSPILQSCITFLIRRGLTLLGTAGTQVSDDWVTQAASLAIVAWNEGWQWYQAHKVKKPEMVAQAGTVTLKDLK